MNERITTSAVLYFGGLLSITLCVAFRSGPTDALLVWGGGLLVAAVETRFKP